MSGIVIAQPLPAEPPVEVEVGSAFTVEGTAEPVEVWDPRHPEQIIRLIYPSSVTLAVDGQPGPPVFLSNLGDKWSAQPRVASPGQHEITVTALWTEAGPGETPPTHIATTSVT